MVRCYEKALAAARSRGAAAYFDEDGDIDFFVPTGAGIPDRLNRNPGNGQFEEIAQETGLDSTDANRTGLWFDHDADGVLDLLVAKDVEHSPTMYRLYRQVGNAPFQDVTVEWPDGTQDVLINVSANQVLTVQQTGPPLNPAVSAWCVPIVLLLLLVAGTAIIRARVLLGR